MMNKPWIFIVSCLIVMVFAKTSRAGEHPAQSYTLRLPALRETSQDYESTLNAFDAQLRVRGNKQQLIPVAEHLLWFSSRETKRKHDGWTVEQDKQGNMRITGFWRLGEANYRIELHGVPLSDGWKGTGIAAMGTDPRLEQFPLKYNFQWSMVQQGSAVVHEISNRVQYEGPPPEVVSVVVPSPEQMKSDAQNKPPINVLTVKALSYESPEVRAQQVARLPKEAREYLKDKVLSDLSWEEIQRFPGVIMLVDFLADLDVTDQQRMATAYARDGSAMYLKGHNFADLRDVPPVFLLVHCYPNLEKSQRQEIRKASRRLQKIMDVLERRNNVTPADLEDVMQEALSEMSKKDREEFFSSSMKLKDFVKRSQNGKLKALLYDDTQGPPRSEYQIEAGTF